PPPSPPPGCGGAGAGPHPAAGAARARREADALARGGEAPAYAALPGTRHEVTAIARFFAQKEVLLGSDASEQRLDELAQQGRLREFRVVHLATHAVLDGRRPMQSALILAQDRLPNLMEYPRAGQPFYSGRLTA